MSLLGLYFTKNPLARALRVGKVATLAHARFALREPGKSPSWGGGFQRFRLTPSYRRANSRERANSSNQHHYPFRLTLVAYAQPRIYISHPATRSSTHIDFESIKPETKSRRIGLQTEIIMSRIHEERVANDRCLVVGRRPRGPVPEGSHIAIVEKGSVIKGPIHVGVSKSQPTPLPLSLVPQSS